MAANQTSFELLAHFDRPKTVELPDFDVDWEASGSDSFAEDPPETLGARFAPPQPPLPVRGVGWVLQWAGAVAVLGFAATMLAESAYLTMAELALARAARAGAVEATLPRATQQTIAATIDRRLIDYPSLANRLRFSLQQNGQPVGKQFRPAEGDRLSVTLAAPSSSAVPSWLRTLTFWRETSQIHAHAEQQLPGRKLVFGAGLFGAGLPTSPSR